MHYHRSQTTCVHVCWGVVGARGSINNLQFINNHAILIICLYKLLPFNGTINCITIIRDFICWSLCDMQKAWGKHEDWNSDWSGRYFTIYAAHVSYFPLYMIVASLTGKSIANTLSCCSLHSQASLKFQHHSQREKTGWKIHRCRPGKCWLVLLFIWVE